jgi:hypothetical protein
MSLIPVSDRWIGTPPEPSLGAAMQAMLGYLDRRLPVVGS